VLWIILAYGTEKFSIPITLAVTIGSNTKMVYNVLKHSVAKCTKVHIRIS